MNPAPTILIVEDDASIRRGLELNLQAEGYATRAVATAEEGLEALGSEPPALVLLDVMLPGRSGLWLCAEVRRRGHPTPIVLLSARGSEEDVVRGLEQGADDYVVKPFRIRELLARVAARLRRIPPRVIHRFGDVEVDLGQHLVRRAGASVELSPTEFDLLRLLLERRGDVLTRDTILDAVWGAGYGGTDRTVDNFITRLRQKLDTPGTPRFFLTVRGVGYRMVPEDP